MLPNSNGGISLPDLQRYYWVVQLTRVVDWKIQTFCNGWVGLEYLISGLDLRLVPWFPRKHVSPALLSHPLFDRACDPYAVSSKFSPGQSKAFLAAKWPHAEVLAKHFFSRGHFWRLDELTEFSNTALFPFWSYLHLKNDLDNPSCREHFKWCGSLCALSPLPRVM